MSLGAVSKIETGFEAEGDSEEVEVAGGRDVGAVGGDVEVVDDGGLTAEAVSFDRKAAGDNKFRGLENRKITQSDRLLL